MDTSPSNAQLILFLKWPFVFLLVLTAFIGGIVCSHRYCAAVEAMRLENAEKWQRMCLSDIEEGDPRVYCYGLYGEDDVTPILLRTVLFSKSKEESADKIELGFDCVSLDREDIELLSLIDGPFSAICTTDGYYEEGVFQEFTSPEGAYLLESLSLEIAAPPDEYFRCTIRPCRDDEPEIDSPEEIADPGEE